MYLLATIPAIAIKILLIILLLSVLYLLAIMPRMRHKPDTTPLHGTLYAHRGLHDNHGDAPENSLAAFRKAISAGYGIELDLQLSKDGQVIIFHDDKLERVCGVPGRASDYTYEELQQFRLFDTTEQIPLFRDFLKLTGGRVPLIVELKVPALRLALCPAADKLLSGYRGIYCIESFNPLALLWYRRHRNHIIRGQLADRFTDSKEYRTVLHWLLQNLLLNWVTKPDFVAFHHRHHHMLSRRICRKIYRNLAVAWTIKSKDELEQAGTAFSLFIFDSFEP